MQTNSTPPPTTTTSTPAGASADFYAERLPNGLQIIAQPMPDVESVAVAFAVVTGARDEPRELMGVSHFLEHMLFKGTARRRAEDISREFNEIGADFNAFTSHEWTVYYARVLAEYLPRAVDLLGDMLRPRLDAEEFARERQVILEEIARAEDQPGHVLWDVAMRTYFGDNPLGHRVLGTTETISALRVEQMRDYHARRYVPNNIVMAVAGKFDRAQLRELAEAAAGSWTPGEAGRDARPYRPTPRVVVERRPEFQQEHIGLLFPSVSMQDEDTYAAHVLTMVLGDTTGSRLFWAVYQNGLAEHVSSSLADFDATGLVLTYASAAPAKAPAALASIRAELAALERAGVGEDELARAKMKLMSSVVMNGEASDRRMFNLATSWLSRGRLETLDEQVDRIKAVTVDDVGRVLERFPPTRDLVIVAVGPMAEAELLGT